MSKVTSKRQVTIPKVIADRYGIRAGDEVSWIPAGDEIRLVPAHAQPSTLSLADRLDLFDAASARITARAVQGTCSADDVTRTWTREELHDRTRPD